MGERRSLGNLQKGNWKEQIFRFLCVGGIATIIDYGSMMLLVEIVRVEYFCASTISFLLSVMINYWMSLHWVYTTKKEKHGKFVLFLILSFVGLGINQFFMWIGVAKLGIHYIGGKAGATVIVMIYNFISRKILLERI